MRETPPPSRRQPPERESEDENHQGSGDVGGQRNGGEGGKHRGVVAPSRAVHGRKSAEPNTREGREELLLDRLGDFSLPIKRPAGRDADEQKSDRDDAKENDDEREQTLGEMGHPAWRVSGFPRPRGDRRCA